MSQGLAKIPDKVFECYNYEDKIKYLNYKISKNVSDSTITNYVNLLRRIAPYEKLMKRDISLFTKNQYLTMFDSLATSRSGYARFRALISDYCKFLGRSVENLSFTFSDIDVDNNIINRYVKDFDSLYEYLESYLNKNTHSINVFKRVAIMLSYVGLSKQEICTLKQEDIDYVNQTIFINGHKFEDVPRKCLDECYLCKVIGIPQEGYCGYKVCKYELSDKKYVIRKRINSNESPDTCCDPVYVIKAFTELNRESELDIDYQSARYSHLFVWLYQEECAGRFSPEKGREYTVDYCSKKFQELYTGQEMLYNYIAWRKAFYGY